MLGMYMFTCKDVVLYIPHYNSWCIIQYYALATYITCCINSQVVLYPQLHQNAPFTSPEPFLGTSLPAHGLMINW